MRNLILILVILIAPAYSFAGQSSAIRFTQSESHVEAAKKPIKESRVKVKRPKNQAKKRGRIRRGIAILLAILLGPFGVHRLYLGTSERIPLFYTLTLGGLMILPIIDIFCLLFAKDIGKYINCETFLMW